MGEVAKISVIDMHGTFVGLKMYNNMVKYSFLYFLPRNWVSVEITTCESKLITTAILHRAASYNTVLNTIQDNRW